MKIHKFGKKQNTKGQIYRCKKLNQDICYTFLIIHDLKCPRICGHAVFAEDFIWYYSYLTYVSYVNVNMLYYKSCMCTSFIFL